MIHPATRVGWVSGAVGRGVFATAAIPRGTIVWTQDRLDRILTPADLAALGPSERAEVERFSHTDADGRRILCWDAGRLVNHACAPTLRGIGPWMMVAVRNLRPGDEITCDYAECNLDPALDCACGHPACRGRVHGRDLLEHGPRWDLEVAELLPAAGHVAQPLWPHLLDPEEAQAMLDGQRPVPSFRDQCAFPPEACSGSR